jgi:hypothetical protein
LVPVVTNGWRTGSAHDFPLYLPPVIVCPRVTALSSSSDSRTWWDRSR